MSQLNGGQTLWLIFWILLFACITISAVVSAKTRRSENEIALEREKIRLNAGLPPDSFPPA